MKLELKNFFDKNIKEKIENMENRIKMYFEKLNKKDEANKFVKNIINENEIKKGFSYKCVNSKELYTIINKGDDKDKIKIILKNNGSVADQRMPF